MVRSAIDPIRPGASLILAWQIKQKHVVIIGGGFVAAGRLVNVLEADAKVTLICPDTEDMSEIVRQHLQDHAETTRWVQRSFQDSDLLIPFGQHPSSASSTQESLNHSTAAVDMVLSAIDDIPLSTHIYNLCKQYKIPVNIADVPPQCDFYFCSTHRDKSLQVAVSTSGKGPKMANLIRRHIADTLPDRVGDAIEQVGQLRAKLRVQAPENEQGPKRMQWMSKVCEQWAIKDLATLDEPSMEVILQGFEQNLVFSSAQVKAKLVSLQDQVAPTAASAVTPVADHDGAIVHQEKRGRLVLVGAGPGDPELLTRKAARRLEEADLVVADRLIPSEVLELARGEVRIAPKKRVILPVEQVSDQSPASGTTPTSPTDEKAITSDNIQDQLNAWCLEGLQAGKTVVRLKQGDPFIFGRGAEEILFFQKHGFDASEIEVIPGISSALSAPLAANVPLTHRGSSDQVVITTAQAKGGVLPDNFPEYDAKRTVVVLMGVGKAKEISDRLQSASLRWPKEVPVVIVENAHCENERVFDATLETLAQVVEEKKAVPPAVFV
ncbi:hypothetical protein BGW38_003634, partial [Lunasporangiospora selenospora]